jgi:hypothetical protein
MLEILAFIDDLLASAFPLVLLLTAAVLHTFAPHHRLLVTERVKAGRISEAAARCQMGFVRWSVPTLITLGAVLTTLLIWERLL